MTQQNRAKVLWMGVVLAMACHEAPSSDTGPEPLVVTMFDLDRTLAKDPNTPFLPIPGGIPFEGRFAREGGNLVARTIPAFADGQVAAYITTEYWSQIPKIWVQPMYVLTNGRDNNGKWIQTTNAPIFSIAPIGKDGKTSAFYSPYWQVYYVTVPATNTKVYRSVHEIFADKLPLEAGEPRLCSLVPVNAVVETFPSATVPGGMETRHPITGAVAGSVGVAKGFVDGVDFKVFSFGTERFTYDAQTRIVDEQPLFVPVVRSSTNGSLQLAGLPAILGSRGLYQPGNGAVIGKNKPNFGSLWRVYLLLLPPGAGVQVPGPEGNGVDRYRYQRDVLVGNPDNIVALAPDKPSEFSLRVLLNPACLNPADAGVTDTDVSPSCEYLDSQDAVEKRLPRSSIIDTGITANCPLVMYNGRPVQ